MKPITNPVPYSAYKDSGVGWLGEVPAHWEVRRLKQICRLAYGDSLTTDVRQEGIVPVFGSNGRVGFHNSANTEAPCIVIGRKGSFGKVNYSRVPVFAIDTTFFIDSRFSSTHIRWLFFLLIWLRLDEVTKDSAIPGLDREDAYQRLAAVPPFPEQTAITRYLDYTDRRIQRYIRAKQKLITLLEEQKQAIIHQAVTGQIDVRTGQPYPAYKDSGVEWLGEVPEHWGVAALRHRYFQCLGKMLDSKRVVGNHLLPYLRNTDVQWDRINIRDLPKMDIFPEEYSRYTVQCGDLLVCEGGEVGRCALWSGELAICGFQKALHRLRPRDRDQDVARFMYYALRAAAEQNAFTDGHISTIAHLTGDKFRAHRFPFPTFSEQTAIVHFLDHTTTGIDHTISRTQRQIDLLSEYRTRLISDVVTGKLDVREAATALPEVDPLETEDDSADTLEPITELAEELEAIAEGVEA